MEEIEAYYTDIRRGRKPPPELLAEVIERYEAVGGKTPLLKVSRAQAASLQKALGPHFQVFLGMKHWHPYIRNTVTEMRDAGITRAVGVVLAPHFSRGSVGEYAERVANAKEQLLYDLDITIVESWHLNPHYLDAVEMHVRKALEAFDNRQSITLIFTAHSLPERAVAEGDPYQHQLMATSRALADRLGLDDDRWRFSFQSAGRTQEPWLGPDLVTTINHLADQGMQNLLVVPIGFISDHLEIFYDIDREAKDVAQSRDVSLERIQSLNDDPNLISALEDVVRHASCS